MRPGLIITFAVTSLLSLALTFGIRNLAVRRGWMRKPSPHHIHRRPVPRLGGVAIFISFIALTLLLEVVQEVWGGDLEITSRFGLHILVPGAMVFLLGLYDDFRPVTPLVKVVVQSLAAALLYLGGIGMFNLPRTFGLEGLDWLDLPLTIIWVLWITNAFNIIDGLDGLAAGSTLFSALTIAIFTLVSGNDLVSVMAFMLAASILGFLCFNFNPATIFLGDSGSLFLGFMLSALSLAGAQKTPTLIAVAIPLVAFGLPVLETFLSVVRRFISGKPLFRPDREHIHHKLLERGLSQRQAVIILYGVSALCGLLSLVLLRDDIGAIALVVFIVSLGIWLGVKRLGYYEFAELGRMAHQAINQKRIIARNLSVRRACDRMLSASSLTEIRRTLQEAIEASDFDGFRLRVNRYKSDQSAAQGQRIEEQYFTWSRTAPDQTESRDTTERVASLPAAALMLELETLDRMHLGSLALYHAKTDSLFLTDFNLLASEFRRALADAIYRVMTTSESALRQVAASESQPVPDGRPVEEQRPGRLGYKTA